MTKINGRAEYIKQGAVYNALENQCETPAHKHQIDSLVESATLKDIRKKHTCRRVAALEVLYHEFTSLNQ